MDINSNRHIENSKYKYFLEPYKELRSKNIKYMQY